MAKTKTSNIDPEKILSSLEDREHIAEALKEVKSQADIEKIREYLLRELHSAICRGDEAEIDRRLKKLAESNLTSVSRSGGGYSYVNTCFILRQLPTATALATEKKWKKLGYRPVKDTDPIYLPIGGGGRFRVPNKKASDGKWYRQTMPMLSEYQNNNNFSDKEMSEKLGVSEKTYSSYKNGARFITEAEYDVLAKRIGVDKNSHPYLDWKNKFSWSANGGRVLVLYDISEVSPIDPSKPAPKPPSWDSFNSVYTPETIERFIKQIMQDRKIAFKEESLATPYRVSEDMGGIVCTVNKNIEDKEQRNFASLCGLCAAVAVKQYAGPAGASKKLEENIPAIANLAAYITSLRFGIPCGGVKSCIEACGRGIEASNFGLALDTALSISSGITNDFSTQICELTQDAALKDFLSLFEDREVKGHDEQAKQQIMRKAPEEAPAEPAETEAEKPEAEDASVPAEPEEEEPEETMKLEDFPDFDDLMFL